MARRTPLYTKHIEAGGVMVDFGGYELPVRYTDGILAEHAAVRERAGLFDVSHMGEILVEGKATAYLEKLLSNRFSDMAPGKVRYSLMLYPEGGIVDDVLVYRRAEESYLVVVNAANREKDYLWMTEHAEGVTLTDASDETALLALQGPLTREILKGVNIPDKYYTFLENVDVFGINATVSRTGYTGEYGVEIFVKNADAEALWTKLSEKGAPYGLVPAGLGARDTLRLEAAMPLYGHELKREYFANEVALDFAVKTDKNDFIGREALLKHVPEYERIGAFVDGKGIAREGAAVFDESGEIGIVTSGTMSPTLGRAIAMLRVKKARTGGIYTEVRGRRLNLIETPLPFYKKKK